MIELLTEVRHHGLQCFRVSGTFSGGYHTLYESEHNSEEIHIMIRKMIHLMADYLEKNESCLVMMNKISQYSGIKLALKIIMFLWNKSNNLKVQRDIMNYFNNKLQYKRFKQQQLCLLNISKRDNCPEAEMIFLASLFYRHKRYHIVLEQVSYVLSRAVKTEASALKTLLKPVFNEIQAMFILNFLTNYVIIF